MAHRRRFEAARRVACSGVNAVTLMEIREPGDAEQQAFVPVVRYASRQGIGDGARLTDHATRLELGHSPQSRRGDNRRDRGASRRAQAVRV
jgi:hypothetical protein